MTEAVPLRHLAEVLVSNVDKKSVEGEQLVRLCNYTDVYYNDRITPQIDFMSASATPEQVRKFALRAGDSIITKDSETPDDIAVAAFVPESLPEVVCGYHLAVVRPRKNGLDPRYLAWALRSDYMREQFSVRASGVTRYGLSYEAVRGAAVPLVADVLSQRRIANFLDHEVARIEAVLSLRGRQRHLLLERQGSAVDQAVLRLDAPRAPLGVVARLQTGMALNAKHVKQAAVFRPYLRVANVKSDYLDLSEVKEVPVDTGDIQAHSLRPGDVLMTEGGDLDKLARGTVWRGEIKGAVHQNHVFAVRPRPGLLDSDYLALLTQTSYARAYFEKTGSRSTNLASTSAFTVRSFRVPMLSLRDQQNVAARAAAIIRRGKALDVAYGRSARLLGERKRALITAAVTGEFDVSTASRRAAEAVIG